MRINWKEFLFKEFPNGKLIQSSRGEEYNIDCINSTCPNPKHHMFVNIESNSEKHDKKFICHRCGFGGNHRTFLIEYFNLPYNEILSNISDLYGLEEDAYTTITKNIKDLSSSLIYDDDEEEHYFTIDLPRNFLRIRESTQYLINRDFPEWALSRYKIGVCKSGYYKGRLIFPIKTGKSRSFLAYSQDTKKQLKMYKRLSKRFKNNKNFWTRSRKILYPSKSITSMLLFNYGGVKQYDPLVIIVEGVMDALRIIDLGYNAVAKLGGFLSDEQCQLLSDKEVGEYVFMPDSDVSEESINKSLTKLRNFCDSNISHIKLESGDPDDIRSEVVLLSLIEKRIKKSNFLIKNDDLKLL
jgi:DNA primase